MTDLERQLHDVLHDVGRYTQRELVDALDQLVALAQGLSDALGHTVALAAEHGQVAPFEPARELIVNANEALVAMRGLVAAMRERTEP